MSHQILCIGEALIDMICTDKGSSLSAGENFLKKPGGAPTNVAAAIAALGGKVSIAAKVGNDPFGKQLIDVMQDFSVDTTWMLKDDAHFTTLAFVSLMENGERDFIFSRGADGQLSETDISGLNIHEFPIVHFGSATGFLPGPLQMAYKGLLEKAITGKNFVSFDPNFRQLLFQNNTRSFIDQSWYFIERCNFFKVSDEEALLLTGAANVEDSVHLFRQRSAAVFAITIGEKGTLLSIGEMIAVIPSIPVKPVDTTGAGDAFVGAILKQVSDLDPETLNTISEETWRQMITNANKAGARTCEYMGAMEAFKHLSATIIN